MNPIIPWVIWLTGLAIYEYFLTLPHTPRYSVDIASLEIIRISVPQA